MVAICTAVDLPECLQAGHLAHMGGHITEGLAPAASAQQQRLDRKRHKGQVMNSGDTVVVGQGRGPGPGSSLRGAPVAPGGSHVPSRVQTTTHKADTGDKLYAAAGHRAQNYAPQDIGNSSHGKLLQPALQHDVNHRLRGQAGADRYRYKDKSRDSSPHSCRDTSRERPSYRDTSRERHIYRDASSLRDCHPHQHNKHTSDTSSHRHDMPSQRHYMHSHRHDKSTHREDFADRHDGYHKQSLPNKQERNIKHVNRHVHANERQSSSRSQPSWGVASKDGAKHSSDIGRPRFGQHDYKRSRSPHERDNVRRVHQNK